jgi:glycosyltransferase involved in cell wall biosynthesis
MSDVALVHMDLHSKGGGEAVAMNCLEVLQRDHDLTLITLTDPDIEELNEYFNTDVDPAALTVRTAGTLAPTINRLFGVKYYVLQNALLGRYARRHADEFDLLVSTINELGLPAGSIEYVHFPFDWTVSLDNRGDIFHPTVGADSLYERLCTFVADIDGEDIEQNTVFANSKWTARCFEAAYGTSPEILYPPIDTSEFTDVPWDDRENGFVTVGRVERSKHTAEMIEIVDGVRERGHDVHLHVVGPTYDEEYRAVLDEMAASRSYVEFEGEVSRSELVRLICTHRYGLHGKEHEHFGMAVAEIAAGSAIPFVPSSGGQSAIVRDDDRQLYDSTDEAVEKIDRVLSNPALQRELQMARDEIERRFGRDRFRERIRAAAADALGRPVPTEPPAQTAVGTARSADD